MFLRDSCKRQRVNASLCVLSLLGKAAVLLLAMQADISAAVTGIVPVDVPGGYYFKPHSPTGKSQEQRGIAWLDNKRVMFQGHMLTGNRRKSNVGIYIWDTERNEVSTYGEESDFCYATDTIYLWELSTWSRPPTGMEPTQFTQHYRYGAIGKEKPGICRGDGKGKTDGCIGPVNMSCKPRAYADGAAPLGPDSRVLIHLRAGDGVIVASPAVDNLLHRSLSYEDLVRVSRQQVQLVSQGYPGGKPLPIQEVERIGSGITAYSEYKHKYVLVGAIPKNGPPGHFTNWPADIPQPVYLMSNDGEVEVMQVPKLTDWVMIHQAMPSQRGLVYWGSHGRTGGGLFVYDSSRNVALDRGQLDAFSVSPDGCKVAYAIINDYGRGPSLDYKIKYLNLCVRG